MNDMKCVSAECAPKKDVTSMIELTRITNDLLCEVGMTADRLWYCIIGDQRTISPEIKPSNNIMDDMQNSVERASCVLKLLQNLSDVIGTKR